MTNGIDSSDASTTSSDLKIQTLPQPQRLATKQTLKLKKPYHQTVDVSLCEELAIL